MISIATLIFTILGYSICIAFINDLQKQIDAIHEDLMIQFNILNDIFLKLNTENFREEK